VETVKAIWHELSPNLWPIAALLLLITQRKPLAKFLETVAKSRLKVGEVTLNPPSEQQMVESGNVEPGPPVLPATAQTGNPELDQLRTWLDGELKKFPENERSARLFAASVSWYLSLDFWRAYRLMYGSQLNMMRASNVNGGLITRTNAEVIFVHHKNEQAEFYKDVTFEGWLTYPQRCAFIELTGETIALTARGKLFLHFIIDEQLPERGFPYNADK
jgi:hypothetical protein